MVAYGPIPAIASLRGLAEMVPPFSIPPPPPMHNNPKNDNRRRPHFQGYWRKIWAKNRERMSAHLDALNAAKILKSKERVDQVRAFVHLLPQEPMSATRLRDQVAENWNAVYGEDLNSTRAWCLTRLCIREGLFVKGDVGLYEICK
jgi:hypothetical protein